jgi:ubiquinone/menaquinone biosynthesis C-methylase UbiE
VPPEAPEPGIPEVAATGFDRAAAEYERSRPGYPAEVIDLLAAELPVHPRSRILDLAAGTGKLTRGLVRTGARVMALEPLEGMRRQLEVVCPDVELVGGTAESIDVGDESLDAVTVAQAFHWFDLEQALAEIARVLRPDGGLAVLWNVRDETESWVADMSRVIRWDERQIADYKTTDWPSALRASGRFERVTRHQHRWEQSMTKERLADRVRSISYVAASPEADQQQVVDEVLALVADLPDTFPLPYVTDIYCCHRIE